MEQLRLGVAHRTNHNAVCTLNVTKFYTTIKKRLGTAFISLSFTQIKKVNKPANGVLIAFQHFDFSDTVAIVNLIKAVL